MRRLFLLLTVLALIVGACGGADSPDAAAGSTTEPTTSMVATTAPTTASEPPQPAPWPTEGWPVVTPEEVGMSSGLLADLVEDAMTQDRIDSIIVVRNGYVVLDTYFYPFPEKTAHNQRSATKSVTGTLVGIAIDEGRIAGVEVPVVELLPDAVPADVEASKATMTVEDLLTMSSGLSCTDPASTESDDWAAHALARPMSAEPGTRFNYCGSDSHLLSAIVSQVTGISASEYADEVLFGPLGITDYVWPADPQGINYGDTALMLRPVDMAKLGYLYLRDGQWDGDQIVSPSWIEAATTAHMSANFVTEGYGYQWWVDDAGYFMAAGAHGQYIIVMPDHDLVVVFTARLSKLSMVPLSLTNAYVVPAVLSDDPLPPDPDAEARLVTAVVATGAGPEPQEVELAAMAASVDGVRFEYRSNDWGWEWFEIDFHSDTAVAREGTAEGLVELVVGLDGRYRANDELEVAVRGAWPNDTTFVVEFYVFGQVEPATRRYSFEDGVVDVRGEREITSGGSVAAEAFPAG
jgi:CubicO group peptidase (beta-lactamase class C family)